MKGGEIGHLTDRENKEQYEILSHYRTELSGWFNKYSFQWFVSMRLKSYNVETAESLLKIWRRDLCKTNHIQICHLGIIITSGFTGPHVHLLMSGKNRYGKTLMDMDREEWSRKWKGDCHIKPVVSDDITKYITLPRNTPLNHFELVKPYNKYLLEKCRKS